MTSHHLASGRQFRQLETNVVQCVACAFRNLGIEPFTVLFQVLQNFIHEGISASGDALK